MPNWVSNTIIVKGKEKDLLKFVNKGVRSLYKKDYMEYRITDLSDKEKINKLYNHENDLGLSFNTYIPIPQTYLDYDTTNSIEHSLISEMEKLDISDMGVEDFKKTKEGREYSRKWNRAKKYQMNKYGAVGWYDWRCKNYGTKWNCELCISDFKRDGENSLLTIDVDSAWSTPFHFLDKIQEDFPELKMYCFFTEEGYESAGYYKANSDTYVDVDFGSIIINTDNEDYEDEWFEKAGNMIKEARNEFDELIAND